MSYAVSLRNRAFVDAAVPDPRPLFDRPAAATRPIRFFSEQKFIQELRCRAAELPGCHNPTKIPAHIVHMHSSRMA